MKILIRAFIFVSVLSYLSPLVHAGISRPPNNLGLVGYWSMEDCRGIKAGDSSGRGYAGTLSGFSLTGATSNWVAGKRGACALNFDGTDDSVATTIPTQVLPITIAYWAKPNTASPTGMFDTADSQPDALRQIYAFGTSRSIVQWHNSIEVDLNLTAGQWTHITLVLTYDGTRHVTYYRDGVLQTTGSGGASSNLAWTTFTLGDVNHGAAGDWYAGSLDDVRIYSRALTAAEVSALYNSGATRILGASSDVSAGLIGHWKFDDGSGTSATDSSGRGNTGSLTTFALTGATSNWVTGKQGPGLNFDGTSDVATTNINLNNYASVTFSAWVKPTRVDPIGIMGNDNGGYGRVIRGAGGGNLNILGTQGVAGNSVTALPLNRWTHVAVTWGTAAVKVYINGALDNTFAGEAATYDDATTTEFGHTGVGGAGQYLEGTMDDVRIYSTTLSAAQIKNIYRFGTSTPTHANASSATLQAGTSLATGLVGHWTFDGKYTNTASASDTSGLGNGGSLRGANGKPIPVAGKLGQALKFDGVDDYVGSETVPIFQTTNITEAAWVYVPTITSRGPAVSVGRRDASADGYVLGVGGSEFGTNNNLTGLLSAIAWMDFGLAVGTGWHHIAMTRDATTWRGYVDGVVAPTTFTSSPIQPSGGFSIGRESPPRFFPGNIDDVRIYNRALSAAEVTQLYKLGR